VLEAESTVVVVEATSVVESDAAGIGSDDVAAACAETKGVLKIPKTARAVVITMTVPANAMLFVFIRVLVS
jgi:hypothetical protein